MFEVENEDDQAPRGYFENVSRSVKPIWKKTWASSPDVETGIGVDAKMGDSSPPL